jgi:protocadherin Fat 1/2/3
VGSYRDRWLGGPLGRVRASDQDQYDVLLYSIVDPHHGLFNIEERTGVLKAVSGVDAGSYHLNVSVTDGKFTSYEKVAIKVDSLDDDMLNEGISIRLVTRSGSCQKTIARFHRKFCTVL